MTETQVNAFRAVAEAGGFSRGADRLGVSQPAVSLQVSTLERELGIRLFDRLPRGVRPTDAGRVLLGHARRLAAARADAERAMGDLAGVRGGRLAVAASRTVGTYLLPELLGRFRAAHPGVELAVAIGNTAAAQQRVRDGTADLALTEGDPGGDSLTAHPFAHDDLVAIVPPGHPLLSRPRVTAADLCRCPVIAREVGSGTRAVTDRALAGRGVMVRPALELPGPEPILRSVAVGLGVAIVSRLAAARDLDAGRVVAVRLADLTIRRPLHVERPADHPPGPAAAAFLTLVPPLAGAARKGSVTSRPTAARSG